MFVLIVGHPHTEQVALKQALEETGLDWQLASAEDDLSAIAVAMERSADVVVTDVRHGARDGTAVLSQLKTQRPETVRILLLDEDGGNAAPNAFESAHRILNRPLRIEQLVDAVEGVRELHGILDSERIKTLVGGIGRLPAPPRLYLELGRALADPDTTTARIIDLVSRDPAIVAKVLRLCNSAYFSGGRTVVDLRSAVIRLGSENLRRLILVSELFSAGDKDDENEREAMQRRAVLSSRLALNLLGDSSADLTATASMLAEVGSLLPGIDIAVGDDGRPLDSEAPGHAEVGAYLLGLWGLPMPIVEAVAHQLRPGRSRQRGFWVTGATHVACALIAGRPVDEAYLDSVGMLDRLPDWQCMAAELTAETD